LFLPLRGLEEEPQHNVETVAAAGDRESETREVGKQEMSTAPKQCKLHPGHPFTPVLHRCFPQLNTCIFNKSLCSEVLAREGLEAGHLPF